MLTPGCIVRCRNRDWVLLPSERPEVFRLRPLTGATDEVVEIHRHLADLVGSALPEERVRSSGFPPPTPDDLSDAGSAHLLWQAARLTLREGATPLRSLGRISVRPRVYQFVPLLMALRLDPIRLLIADDVGVGKTIEALLIVRELMDRGEVRRLCVLCPPYLCDQWQKELREKFSLDAVVIRSGTVNQLDREKPSTQSIYRYYPVQVASIDFVKTDRNRHQFLLDCPELIVLDEAHGATEAAGPGRTQQERHQLVRDVATKVHQHLVLLTATPHSGIETSFRSLLSLLSTEFGQWNTTDLSEPQRTRLARHFVQRTRKDIVQNWEGDHCFPERETVDVTYRLSEAYKRLFERTYDFCSEIVRTGQELEERKRRVRYWGALALLRCVMSSPEAAIAALQARRERSEPDQHPDEADFRPFVFESADDRTDDEAPLPPVEAAEDTLGDSERRRLRELARLAQQIGTSGDNDTKLVGCAELVKRLLRDGFHPIVWCRYVATAEYVARKLSEATDVNTRVMAITGRLGDDERRAKIDEIEPSRPRVLVATDCLSEGINLQEKFTAAIHYDLPWNPNRLEQREGRVDRFGQSAPKVKAIRYYSPDSPVDGVVIRVLLDKAREIHRSLGTHVPVPEESESVTEAVLKALFLRGGIPPTEQLALDLGVPEVEALHGRWERGAERERINRTKFAQHALKPDEVRRELEAVDAVLGDPNAVREFVLSAAQRLSLPIVPDKRAGVFRVNVSNEVLATLPEAVRATLPNPKGNNWLVSFISPTPEGSEYFGRNHRFVATLARFLMEEALTKHSQARASRCGVMRTKSVERLTTALLVRVRYLIEVPDRPPLLSEEVIVAAYTKSEGESPHWLADAEAMRLLAEAKPDAIVQMPEKRELIEASLREIGGWPTGDASECGIEPGQWMTSSQILVGLRGRMEQRAKDLENGHKRIRQAVSLRVREVTVTAQLPPDLLGVLVLQPMVKR